MSTSHFVINGRACRGCKHCEGGAPLIGLKAATWALALMTGFIWLLVPMFYKLCMCCGHSLYMNSHREGA